MRSFMMKKLFTALLCLLLVGLCACGEVKQEEITAGKGTTEITESKQSTEVSTTAEVKTSVKIKTDPNDPYSYVAADVVDGGIDWPVLSDYLPDWRDHYILYDIDDKGTEALLIGGGNPHGEVLEIYTIKDGVVEKKLSVYDDEGRRTMIMWKNGIISTGELDGGGAGGFYRFDEDGQLKLIMGLGIYRDGGYYRIDPTGTEKDFFFNYIPDGAEVGISGEEYTRLMKEFFGEDYKMERATLDWKPLAEYGQ